MSKNNKIIVKKHILFGTIRFQEEKPYLLDIAKALNYRDDSYIELTKYNITLSEDNIYLLNDKGIDILINNSNIDIPTLFRQWIFEFALPSVRRKINIEQQLPIKGPSKIYINNLNKRLDELDKYIESNDWYITIPVHGFSNNYMFEHTYDGKIIQKKAYSRWIKKFPTQYLDKLSYLDFSKPIVAFYKFDHLEKYDTPNFGKSLSDIIAYHFNVDDHQIEDEIIFKGKTVKSYKEAKTYVFLCNK